jgi:AAA15 family ATPase/GTPase
MIVDFTIKNYRSFKEASSLSLLAEPLKNDGIAISTTAFGDDILPVAGIFGQNAGGKSNVINSPSKTKSTKTPKIYAIV